MLATIIRDSGMRNPEKVSSVLIQVSLQHTSSKGDFFKIRKIQNKMNFKR